MSDVTNSDRAEWAAAALSAYNEAAPTPLFPVPERAERVRLGVIAAEAMAAETRHVPDERVVDSRESAEEIIGDLIGYVFCLTDGQVDPDELRQAAEELRAQAYPVQLTALCAVAVAEAERAAAMLAALTDAAESFGCDVRAMVADAYEFFEASKAEEEEEERDSA
ncbi:hypothetical protein [Streptomyces sp. NPDC127103]|uniref:hypothetical protein n=1 Tax=Streptomyces sp. NPDC127103 TaxID=3347139 RepID=UPI00364FD049